MQPTVSLGLETALDTATARRLHDYGELDDKGVAAALEQTGLQRSRSGRYPDHLARVVQVAAVIDSGDDITLASFEAADIDEEASILTTLFALFPQQTGQAVSWDASDWDLLLRRAYLHMLVAPAALREWPRQSLCRLFEGPQTQAGYNLQADALKLYGNNAAELANADAALGTAIHWYDMELRRRCVAAEIEPQTRRDHLARVIAQVAGKTDREGNA